jgi:hypothetical protein
MKFRISQAAKSSRTIASRQRNVLIYKKFEILETMYNNINRAEILPIFVADMFVLSILSFSTCVKQHNNLSVPVLLMLMVLAFDTLIVGQVIMYKGAGDVHNRSVELKLIWRRYFAIPPNRELQRQIASCNVMKVRLGTTGSFMEKTTSLVSTNLTLEQSIGIILLTK